MALHHRFLLDTNSSTPAPSNVNRTREAFTGDANFDTNMVIILAALLCALICALGLNSIVRCALRCSRRFAFETPEETAARFGGKRPKEEQSLLEQPTISGAVGAGNSNYGGNASAGQEHVSLSVAVEEVG
ncbi:hypothetical protein VIGAN_02180500 [Vigna angularis var. angularis]|uniref:RING-type E3 ubiquitin transferase n=1 Tax=Vigna angularis var. angularis TaxID=157739 RepID=A0A0S3RF19_PHAAN|nr:hypothetical protein VIGAN_02180500 [Vigna angularis var. angularis]